jgi:hypothetical protein
MGRFDGHVEDGHIELVAVTLLAVDTLLVIRWTLRFFSSSTSEFTA